MIHVDHSASPRLVMLGKTCRLCVVCGLLVAHDAELRRLLSIERGTPLEAPGYFVLGTVARDVWQAGMAVGVRLDEVRASMADFKEYVKVEFTPGDWHPAGRTEERKPIRSMRHTRRRT